ncbi:sulfite exporter TauE/SafE family protein [Lutispora sp.]|jgi:uncharacterized membrane protein YfcA|uniref:sulfite exporter TauE/SafE family protein n=1 Tax=Lutispora sp. TaxID=2828727 RepID=UPI003564EB48
MDFEVLIFLCAAGFMAAFVDSIAGGGGIISIPAVMAIGIPPHLALGTNKLGAFFGSFSSTVTYSKSKKIYFPLIKYMIPFTLIGAVLGVETVLSINEKALEIIILVLTLIIAIYTICKKDLGASNDFQGLTKKNIALGCILAFAIGFYDGMFGPGSGSFLIFIFISIYKFDYPISAGNGRILNFTSCAASLITFGLNGSVDFLLGIPFVISMILGGLTGAKFAIKKGAKVIKPIFVAIALALIIKMLYSIL